MSSAVQHVPWTLHWHREHMNFWILALLCIFNYCNNNIVFEPPGCSSAVSPKPSNFEWRTGARKRLLPSTHLARHSWMTATTPRRLRRRNRQHTNMVKQFLGHVKKYSPPLWCALDSLQCVFASGLRWYMFPPDCGPRYTICRILLLDFAACGRFHNYYLSISVSYSCRPPCQFNSIQFFHCQCCKRISAVEGAISGCTRAASTPIFCSRALAQYRLVRRQNNICNHLL